jgi:hypothetical protein
LMFRNEPSDIDFKNFNQASQAFMLRSITGEPPLTAVYPPDQGVIPGRDSVATLLQSLRE